LNPEISASPWATVIGVVTPAIQRNDQSNANSPNLYRLFSQDQLFSAYPSQPDSTNFSIFVKIDDDPIHHQQAIKIAATSVDRDIPIVNISTMSEIQSRQQFNLKFVGILFSTISFVILLLAVTGIYTIVSRSVQQRRSEIGVRRAVGSSNLKVLWVFILQGWKYLGVGLLIGGSGAALIAKAMDSEFAGLVKWLPVATTLTATVLVVLIFFATSRPASKLIEMEPGDALRYE